MGFTEKLRIPLYWSMPPDRSSQHLVSNVTSNRTVCSSSPGMTLVTTVKNMTRYLKVIYQSFWNRLSSMSVNVEMWILCIHSLSTKTDLVKNPLPLSFNLYPLMYRPILSNWFLLTTQEIHMRCSTIQETVSTGWEAKERTPRCRKTFQLRQDLIPEIGSDTTHYLDPVMWK